MPGNSNNYKRYVLLGIILVSLGVTLTTTLKASVPSIGVVMIALGCFFLLVGMREKQQNDKPGK